MPNLYAVILSTLIVLRCTDVLAWGSDGCVNGGEVVTPSGLMPQAQTPVAGPHGRDGQPEPQWGPKKNHVPEEIETDFCLVTHHTQNAYNYAQIAIDSHASYAAQYGYGHTAFLGRITGDRFVDPERGGLDTLWGGGLFWQKIEAVRRVLHDGIPQPNNKTLRCTWVMWLDSDAVITNTQVALPDLLADYLNRPVSAFPIDLIFSGEDEHPLNAGVFFVHNSDVGRGFIAAVMALYPMYKNSNLPEQSAIASIVYMAEPWPANTAAYGVGAFLHPAVALAPQRRFNAFMGVGRTFSTNTQWQPGDFVAHFAGTPWQFREQAMQDVLALSAQQGFVFGGDGLGAGGEEDVQTADHDAAATQGDGCLPRSSAQLAPMGDADADAPGHLVNGVATRFGQSG